MIPRAVIPTAANSGTCATGRLRSRAADLTP
ncbi:hypothetical protein MPOCJGCO_3055 [Methylobacterium trifolii]|uniref:Uncharacterized protein n=1 Tax=Methylobacterium trifolii TaxID=1003092 RepID=A0ABQ4U2G2_9HYPH|nr:hypothetical protein MPOCJGCO_3055 [Methylobacterium trifolii]